MSWKDVLVIVSEAETDEPAIALAEALASQSAACATSHASPIRPIGHCLLRLSSIASLLPTP